MRCAEMGELKTGVYSAVDEETGMEVTIIREEGDGWCVSTPSEDGGFVNVFFTEDGSIEAIVHSMKIDE